MRLMNENKRYGIQHYPLLLTGIILPTIGVAKNTVGGANEQRPNIILFMVDDMGWQDTSLPFWNQRTPFNNRYSTPNMERLASQGMMFTQAYACPISSPSRCSLMTGTNAARHRVTNWTFEKNVSTDLDDDKLSIPAWNYNGITPTAGTSNAYVARTFVDILKEAGYQTIHCGKAHWGATDTPGADPLNLGFEVNIAGHAGGGPTTYLSEHNYGWNDDGTPASGFAIPGLSEYWGSGTFLTEALTREALKALDRTLTQQRPFYLYMSHYAIHIPIDRDMRFYGKYLTRGLSEKEAAYASLIEGMDNSLGSIMNWLEKHGVADNTIVIFMSDNGGYATGAAWRDEPLFVQNYPLKCGKGSMYEGGIREPMIVRWPGHVRAGTKCNKYVMIEDFYPTILDMAGTDYDKVPQIVDGRSFLPLLEERGDPSKDRALVWNYPNVWGNEGPGISMNCAIRKNQWKMIYDYKTGRKELYDIDNDISESIDIATRYPKVVKKLSRQLGRFLRKSGAQRPSFKSSGKACPWPDEI